MRWECFWNVAFLVVADLISKRAFDLQFLSGLFLRRDDFPLEHKLSFVHWDSFVYRFQEKTSRSGYRIGISSKEGLGMSFHSIGI